MKKNKGSALLGVIGVVMATLIFLGAYQISVLHKLSLYKKVQTQSEVYSDVITFSEGMSVQYNYNQGSTNIYKWLIYQYSGEDVLSTDITYNFFEDEVNNTYVLQISSEKDGVRKTISKIYQILFQHEKTNGGGAQIRAFLRECQFKTDDIPQVQPSTTIKILNRAEASYLSLETFEKYDWSQSRLCDIAAVEE
jgi:hypothetical protein